MQTNYITGQREPGISLAAEWGERPRETVTVMPVYSAKSGTQYAAPGPLPVPGPKLLYERFTRLLFGGWMIFCCQAPWCLMLSMESMIAISSRF